MTVLALCCWLSTKVCFDPTLYPSNRGACIWLVPKHVYIVYICGKIFNPLDINLHSLLHILSVVSISCSVIFTSLEMQTILEKT